MSDHATPVPGMFGTVPYHVSYATRDLDRAMAQFSALFGLRWAPVESGVAPGLGPVDTTGWEQRRVVSLGGPVHVELSEGSPGSIWHTDADAELHHLAYWVDDLAVEVQRLVDRGFTMELTFMDGAGGVSEFAYVSAPGWPRLELVDVKRAAAFIERHRTVTA